MCNLFRHISSLNIFGRKRSRLRCFRSSIVVYFFLFFCCCCIPVHKCKSFAVTTADIPIHDRTAFKCCVTPNVCAGRKKNGTIIHHTHTGGPFIFASFLLYCYSNITSEARFMSSHCRSQMFVQYKEEYTMRVLDHWIIVFIVAKAHVCEGRKQIIL